MERPASNMHICLEAGFMKLVLITIILACNSEFTSHKNGSITSAAAQQSSQQVCYLRKNHFKK
jgi:uncharacterized membrane protein YozB (DUF420 family)